MLSNADNKKCPGGCFRPVAVALQASSGRVLMSSDATGEIYALRRTSSSSSGDAPSSSVSSTGKPNAAPPGGLGDAGFWAAAAVAWLSFMGGLFFVLL